MNDFFPYQQFRTARLALGLSIRQVNKQVGLANNTVSAMESGERIPQQATIRKLVEFYLASGVAGILIEGAAFWQDMKEKRNA